MNINKARELNLFLNNQENELAMQAIAVLVSADHRAFANIDPTPPIEPIIYLFVKPDPGVEYIAIDVRLGGAVDEPLSSLTGIPRAVDPVKT